MYTLILKFVVILILEIKIQNYEQDMSIKYKSIVEVLL